MYGACILSKLECICTKVGLYSKYIRTSACVLTLDAGELNRYVYRKRVDSMDFFCRFGIMRNCELYISNASC